MLRTIIITIVSLYLMTLSARYGGIWDSQAHPSENTQVVFNHGITKTGSLHTAWTGEWVLASDSGEELHFSEHEFSMMKFPLPNEPLIWLRRWRAWLPMLIITSLYFVYVLSRAQHMFARGANMETANGTTSPSHS